jgi:hypothetical protein
MNLAWGIAAAHCRALGQKGSDSVTMKRLGTVHTRRLESTKWTHPLVTMKRLGTVHTRQYAVDVPQGSIQRELADEERALQVVGNLPVEGQQGCRDRQVVSRSLIAQVGRPRGYIRPALTIAARTRSVDSLTDRSGSPTNITPGKALGLRSAST